MLCRVMGVTRQGYHAWVSRKPCMHERRDCELAGLICDIYHENRRVYGSPKIFMMLKRTGVKTSRKHVSRLMKEYGLRGVSRGGKRKTTNKPVFQRPSAEDLVNREFSAKEANQAWFADITYVKTHQGWLYLAAVMDIRSRKIVGWSMASSMTAKLVDDALHMAIARRNPPEGCLHHSDPWIPISLFARWKDDEKCRYRSFDGSYIESLGQCGVRVTHGNDQGRVRSSQNL